MPEFGPMATNVTVQRSMMMMTMSRLMVVMMITMRKMWSLTMATNVTVVKSNDNNLIQNNHST